MEILLYGAGIYVLVALGVHLVGRWFTDREGGIEGVSIWFFAWGWPLVVFMMIPIYIAWEGGKYLINSLDNWIAFHFLKRLIHEDEHGQLWRARGPREPFQWVRVQDSTGVYWIPVPPDVRTARGAIGWTYELRHGDYDPVARA